MAKAKKQVKWDFVENVTVHAHAQHKYSVTDPETKKVSERSMDLVAIKLPNGTFQVPVAAEEADEKNGSFIMTLV